jgi:hypothetical protein
MSKIGNNLVLQSDITETLAFVTYCRTLSEVTIRKLSINFISPFAMVKADHLHRPSHLHRVIHLHNRNKNFPVRNRPIH